MGAVTVDHTTGNSPEWDDLVRIWEQADAPEGWKVEIIEGIVTMSPPPSNVHNFIAAKIQRRLYSVLPEDWGIYQTLGTGTPGGRGSTSRTSQWSRTTSSSTGPGNTSRHPPPN